LQKSKSNIILQFLLTLKPIAMLQIPSILIVAGLLFGLFYIIYKGTTSSGLIGGNIPVSNVISHWSHFFKTFALSSDAFYNELEKILASHEMPNSVIKRTTHKEGGLLSASREYLRIKHGDIVFDVCASPFGKDFFISWWLYESAGGMRAIFKKTKFGDFLSQRAANRTFYQVDEEDMFRSCVHECILETVSKVGEGTGTVQLTDADKAFKMGGL
jgi:hypothetical protein